MITLSPSFCKYGLWPSVAVACIALPLLYAVVLGTVTVGGPALLALLVVVGLWSPIMVVGCMDGQIQLPFPLSTVYDLVGGRDEQ